MLDIQTIAAKTRIPVRKIRYVLDHHLLPGTRIKTDAERVGHPRSFTDVEGFGIACAAALLVCGVKRDAVIEFMKILCGYVWEKSQKPRRRMTALESAFHSQREAVAILGDGVNVRFQIDQRDTDWFQPGTLAQLKDFQPRGEVRLNLARLRDDLLSRTEKSHSPE